MVHILENREYTGCLVNFKTEKPSYKVKHSVENPIESRRFLRTIHEPIIDKETWERVQELRKQRNARTETMKWSVLRILFCADDAAMCCISRDTRHKDRKQDCYICGS